MELKEALDRLTPTDYNLHLKSIDLADCYLKQLQYKCSSRSTTSGASFDFEERIGDVGVVEDKASITIKYRLRAFSDEQSIFVLEAEFVLTYSLTDDLPDEFFVIFKNYSAPWQGFPYIRELVHSISGRSGLPQLVLPLRKFLMADVNDQAKTGEKQAVE